MHSFNLLNTSDKRMKQEGLSSIKYQIESIQNSSLLYTHILVSYNETEILKKIRESNI